VSAPPFLGNAYTTVVADAQARFARLEGKDAYFLTGTDEHGSKIVQSAEDAGIEPRQWVDDISGRFRALWPTLNIEHNDFIRTTEPRHMTVVQDILQRVYDSGDIYFDQYEGLYCVGCELYYDEDQLDGDGRCLTHGTKAELLKEQNYFFRMSNYYDWLKSHIADKPDFVRPERYRNELLAMLEKPTDLCISRPKDRLSWAIPLPFDDKFVAYVWFDALINYVSGPGWPDSELFEKYWPVCEHVIGKDILRQHGLYWPCMLRAAGIPMFNHLNVHGFWRGFDGRKMSKSLGNSIEPADVRDVYGADAVRYALLREMPFGVDANIGDSIIAKRMNTDLANDLGNLLSRTMKLVQSSFDGLVPGLGDGPASETDIELRDYWRSATPDVIEFWREWKMSQGIERTMECIRATNRYIDSEKPWELAKSGDTARLGAVLYSCLESLRIASALLWPAMPERMSTLREQLGIASDPTLAEAAEWGLLVPGQALAPGERLFPRADLDAAREREASRKATTEAATGAADDVGDETTDEPALVSFDDFGKLDLRVGTILSAEPVKKTTKLLKLSVDIGEETPRTLVAGVAEHYAADDVVGRQIVVVANLEPAKIRGVESQGMLLAADSGDALSILAPDASVPNGSRVR